MDEQPDIAELSKAGYRLLRASLTRKAKENFEKILQHDAENAYALVGMGDACRKEHQYDDAEKYYKECLYHHPKNSYALFGLAECYKSTEQYDRAIEVWKTYLENDQGNTTVLTRIADSYRKARDFDNSRDFYQRVLDVDSDNSYSLIGMGHLHYDFKHFQKALEYWQKIDQTDSSHVDIRVLTSIGNCYRKIRCFAEGIPYFERALKKQQNNFYALFGLGDCYRGLNVPDKALENWKHILGGDPGNKVILTRAGDACRSLGDIETAKRYYESALAIDFDIYATLGMAQIAKGEGKIEAALVALRDLIEKEPHSHRFYLEAAECYEEIGDVDSAIKLLQLFIENQDRNDRIEAALIRLKSHKKQS